MANMQSRAALVVEDDPDIADAIQEVLAKDFKVECASSAPAAVGCLQRGTPNLLLIDCSLMGDRISRILECVDRTRTAVILMSGDAELLGGLAAFLSYPALYKPFGADKLWTAIDAAQRGSATLADRAAHPERIAVN